MPADYRITYHDNVPRPEGTHAPDYNDYLPLTVVGSRVTALVASGYTVTHVGERKG